MNVYIHQQDNWPHFTWSHEAISHQLGQVRNRQGRLLGKMESLGFDNRNEALLSTLSLDVIKSSEIEGEILQVPQVRSSIARHLGIDIGGLTPSDRFVDGMVEMLLDATQNYEKPLDKDRLFGWQASLFPTGRSGIYQIVTGKWRDDSTGPMQVISGAWGKEKVHFQAPNALLIEKEMEVFCSWINGEQKEIDLLLKAAIAHLWFITIHPFDDGNGRVARAITDMLLARSDESSQRFYSMSAQIRVERNEYYDILEKTQKGTLDITNWIEWFLRCLDTAIQNADLLLENVLTKAYFWKNHAKTQFNERQILMINKLFDGFEGKLTSSKWAKIAKCSSDTAVRDITDLIQKMVLQKDTASGRSTNYDLIRNQDTR